MKKEIDKFAFLVHPISVEHFYKTLYKFPFFNSSKYFFKNLLKKIPPYNFLHIKNIIGPNNREIEGYAILCPLTPDQMFGQGANFAKDKIITACKLAQKLGAKIIGLGGFTSIATDGGNEIIKYLNIPVTSGNTFTAYLSIEAILEMGRLTGTEFNKANIAIIGATGDIGSICSEILSNYFHKLILVARDQERLKIFAEEMNQRHKTNKIYITNNINEAISQANFVLIVTSAFSRIIDPQDLRPGTIVCDVSYPANIDMELASQFNDKIIFEGGVAQTACFVNSSKNILKKISFFNSLGTVHGCFAETVLLTLEKKFENFSIGRGNITINKINQIRDIAAKHKFSLAPFICGKRILNVNSYKGFWEKYHGSKN